MKSKVIKSAFIMAVLTVFSCNDPETVVTDIVHPDGSVTRKIEMKSSENKFDVSVLKVPFDNTWIIKDSIEINEKGDTTWIKRAEKLFGSVDEINMSYKTDSGVNRKVNRMAEFSRRFRWFNTEYSFAEIIDKELNYGYPVSEFLNKEELAFFYSPQSLLDAKRQSADSLKIKSLEDSVKHKSDNWWMKCAVSEWIGEFCKLTEGKTGADLSRESLRAREEDFFKIFTKYEQEFDSLWDRGVILKELIGESNAARFKTEADSAMNMLDESLLVDFKDYSLKMVMPGRLIGTNGFIDSCNVLLWPVRSDFFLTEPYRMWAESKTTNLWAWIVTGIFLIFVVTGLLLKVIRK